MLDYSPEPSHLWRRQLSNFRRWKLRLVTVFLFPFLYFDDQRYFHFFLTRRSTGTPLRVLMSDIEPIQYQRKSRNMWKKRWQKNTPNLGGENAAKVAGKKSAKTIQSSQGVDGLVRNWNICIFVTTYTTVQCCISIWSVPTNQLWITLNWRKTGDFVKLSTQCRV